MTATLPSEGGYAGIGPNFIPAVVAAGMILLGVWLSLRGLHRRLAQAAPSKPEAFEPSPFLWVSAGLLAHMAADRLGRLRDRRHGACSPAWRAASAAGAGCATWRSASSLSLAMYLFFVKLLNVNLPAGWLAPVLGGAGI